ncbi:MAG: hypothetical protein N2558_03945 [Patescibacteria group bacterium]|nr:hypothetical protein [Patescibacteria group bacterium]
MEWITRIQEIIKKRGKNSEANQDDLQSRPEEKKLQIEAYRIETVEELSKLPTPPNIFEDPNWMGNNEENIENFRMFWQKQGRSREILEKLLQNVHFISKLRYIQSLIKLIASIDQHCQKPIILSTPPTGISPLEIKHTIDNLDLLKEYQNIKLWWKMSRKLSIDEIINFFELNPTGTFVGIDDAGYSGSKMSLSTTSDHLNYNWPIEYALVAASKQAIENYFRTPRVRGVHLCYRILALNEIFEKEELKELASYYNATAEDIGWLMTTFRHNTVADYFFRGLLKDRNYPGTPDYQNNIGIIELYRLRDSRKQEFGLK